MSFNPTITVIPDDDHLVIGRSWGMVLSEQEIAVYETLAEAVAGLAFTQLEALAFRTKGVSRTKFVEIMYSLQKKGLLEGLPDKEF